MVNVFPTYYGETRKAKLNIAQVPLNSHVKLKIVVQV
jgi:hypothetical protein